MCILLSIQSVFSKTKKKGAVLFCYGKIDVNTIKNYTYVILEGSYYNKEDVTVLKEHNKIVLSYISLGEVHPSVSFFKEAKEYTLKGKNQIWGGLFLDLSKEPLKKIMLNQVSKNIEKGFHGLFLDNIDNYGTWGKQKHLQSYLISFLNAIKLKYPTIHLMQNAGLDVLKNSAKYINSLAIESIISNYNFKDKKYAYHTRRMRKRRIKDLKKMSVKYSLPTILIE